MGTKITVKNRTDAFALVLEQIQVMEARLVRVIPPDFLAAHGPRYVNLKDGLVDLNRAFQSSQLVIRECRENPAALASSLISLSAVAAKLASDIATAAGGGSFQFHAFDDFET
jgi:hypothetical protein